MNVRFLVSPLGPHLPFLGHCATGAADQTREPRLATACDARFTEERPEREPDEGTVSVGKPTPGGYR